MNLKESLPLARRCLGLVVIFGLGIGLAIAPLTAGTIVYTHDAAGRLTVAGYGEGKFIGYTYDNAGNLTLRQLEVIGTGDFDSDGMDDSWEFGYFQTLARDGSGDFDADGMTDLSEFLAGTLPNDAASGFRIIRVTPTPGVSALIEWTSVPGKTYRVQYKNSTGAPAWSNLPGDVPAADNTASKVDTTFAGAGQRLYRVALVTSTTTPSLSIVRTNNNQVLMIWPGATPASFVLETTTNLAMPFWAAVTNAPSDDGANKKVLLTIEPQAPARFFRLRQ